MEFRILAMLATALDFCTGPIGTRCGHPLTPTIRVLAALRQFLREGTPWRSLKAAVDKASGSTLRRRLQQWAQAHVLQQVHAVLLVMVRGHPDLILDTCSVRAKRGGDLIGPNPTDRAKKGTKYHVAVTGEGLPVACVATAANINDTILFERLFLMASAVLARIRTRDMMPSTIARSVGSSEPSRASTSVAGGTDRAGPTALAGRTLQRLDFGE